MHCSYCGTLTDTDEVVRSQRVGFDSDSDNEQLTEVFRFISTSTCDCGTITAHEFTCMDNLQELEMQYELEELGP